MENEKEPNRLDGLPVAGRSVAIISEGCLDNPWIRSPLDLESALIWEEVVAFAYDAFRAR